MKKYDICSAVIICGMIVSPLASLHQEEENEQVFLINHFPFPHPSHDHTPNEYDTFHFNDSERVVVSSSASSAMRIKAL